MEQKMDNLNISILGGLNSFGMNAFLVESKSTAWMVDCGIGFAEHYQPGVDLRIPDFDVIAELGDKFAGVVITHGHEDHIGGIPHLLRHLQRDVKLVCSPMTYRLLESKLAETEVAGFADFLIVEPGDVFADTELTFEFFHVNHSIPGCFAIRMSTDDRNFLFTGDWKIDPSCPGEPVTELGKMALPDGDGYDIVFGDSTNAGVPGSTTSEKKVIEELEGILAEATGRVIVGMFSSHTRRAAEIMRIAESLGKKVGVLGRSIERNLKIAQEEGYVSLPPGIWLKSKQVLELPDDEIILLATGTQGEERATINRAAFGTHSLLNFKEGDTVLFSARVIPGNGPKVTDMAGQIHNFGAKVITSADKKIHTSGHAYSNELLTLMAITQPKWLAPIHGDLITRTRHADLGRSVGYDILFLEDGDTVSIGRTIEVGERLNLKEVIVEGDIAGEFDNRALSDRRALGTVGAVAIYAEMEDDHPNRLILTGAGLFGVDIDQEEVLDECSNFIMKTFKGLEEGPRREIEILARRFFRKYCDRKPKVMVILD